MTSSWWLVVPFRWGSAAKSRLVSHTADARQRLALAFALDACAAGLAVPAVEGLIVVGDGPEELLALGAVVVPDPGTGLNAAIAAGARHVPDGAGAVALVSDLPALRTRELSLALDAAAADSRCFVSDAEGVGTTALMSRDPLLIDPRFGERSRAAHASSGAREIDLPDLPGLHRDVDDEVALWDALRLGVGIHTSAALAG